MTISSKNQIMKEASPRPRPTATHKKKKKDKHKDKDKVKKKLGHATKDGSSSRHHHITHHKKKEEEEKKKHDPNKKKRRKPRKSEEEVRKEAATLVKRMARLTEIPARAQDGPTLRNLIRYVHTMPLTLQVLMESDLLTIVKQCADHFSSVDPGLIEESKQLRESLKEKLRPPVSKKSNKSSEPSSDSSVKRKKKSGKEDDEGGSTGPSKKLKVKTSEEPQEAPINPSATPKTATPKEAELELKPSANEEMRSKVRGRLREALRPPPEWESEVEDSVLDSLVKSIEKRIFKLCGQDKEAYTKKFRTLHASFKSNADLRSRVVDGSLSPSELLLMSTEDLSTEDSRAAKKAVVEKRMKELELLEPPYHHDDMTLSPMSGSAKTSGTSDQGEEEDSIKTEQ